MLMLSLVRISDRDLARPVPARRNQTDHGTFLAFGWSFDSLARISSGGALGKDRDVFDTHHYGVPLRFLWQFTKSHLHYCLLLILRNFLIISTLHLLHHCLVRCLHRLNSSSPHHLHKNHYPIITASEIWSSIPLRHTQPYFRFAILVLHYPETLPSMRMVFSGVCAIARNWFHTQCPNDSVLDQRSKCIVNDTKRE
jgi:hypothetical protein